MAERWAGHIEKIKLNSLRRTCPFHRNCDRESHLGLVTSFLNQNF